MTLPGVNGAVPILSLRPLCVLCVSVVSVFIGPIYHRDTKDTEIDREIQIKHYARPGG
jgi:hypothetical protein